MRGRWLILVLILPMGCKLAGEKAPATTASNDKDKPKTKHWLDEAKPDWAKGDVPKAGSWADPRDPKFDYANYVKGALAGYVLDSGEKPAPNAIIAVEPANPSNTAKPMVVLADQTGSFVVHGLQSNETYSLTAKVRDGGVLFVGQTHATPPSVHVRIRLKEQMNLPSGPGFGQIDGKTPIASKSPTGPPQPVGDLPPLPGVAPIERDRMVPSTGTDRTPGDGGWSPIQPNRPSRPIPPLPDSNELPMPSSGGPRPDLTTTAPAPTWKPPTAELPQPAPTPTITPPPLSGRGSGSSPAPSVSRKLTVSLMDASGRPVSVPNGMPGELVLLDFMTSTCVPCKKAIPELIEFQRRYGANGVEVVGVLCDQASETERRQLAGTYVKEFGLNYLIHTEAKVGDVQKQFKVKGYPTLILLDASGDVLWTGHPKAMNELEPVVRAALSKR